MFQRWNIRCCQRKVSSYVAIKYTIPPNKKDAMWYETCRRSITRRQQAEGNPSAVGIFRPTRRGHQRATKRAEYNPTMTKTFRPAPGFSGPQRRIVIDAKDGEEYAKDQVKEPRHQPLPAQFQTCLFRVMLLRRL